MKKKCGIITAIVGFGIFIIGIVIYFIIPVIVHHKILQMLPLKNNTFIYDNWVNPKAPIFLQIWYFTITNPDEVLTGKKPYVKQIGPYCYREHRLKHNITFNSNGSVSYLIKRVFHFDREKSVGDENDTVTVVNIPLVVIGNLAKDFPWGIRVFLSGLIKSFENNDFFFQTSVKNITWGYNDSLLLKIKNIIEKLPIPPININPTVGLLYGKNDTYDEMYTIDSGNVNLDNYMHINKWNGSSHVSVWNDQYANMINGTDGTMMGPFLNKSSRLYAYQSDICRSLEIVFKETVTYNGIPGFSFIGPDKLLANATENPDNMGFCVDGHCLGAGVLNLTKCIPGVPMLMSEPHFYKAASKYIDAIDGIHPREEYNTIVIVEPTTGFPLNLQKKMQLNVAIEPIKGYMNIDKIPSVFMPVLWMNESFTLDEDLQNTLKQQLILPVMIGKWLSVALMILGLLVLSIVILIYLISLRHRTSKFQKLSDENSINAENT